MSITEWVLILLFTWTCSQFLGTKKLHQNAKSELEILCGKSLKGLSEEDDHCPYALLRAHGLADSSRECITWLADHLNGRSVIQQLLQGKCLARKQLILSGSLKEVFPLQPFITLIHWIGDSGLITGTPTITKTGGALSPSSSSLTHIVRKCFNKAVV